MPNPNSPVVVIGDIMLDILIKPLGDIRPASDTASVIRLALGGQGANVAVNLARIGVPVQLLACVGDDTLGAVALDALGRAGVGYPGELVANERTGALAALVDARGERTMFPQVGANGRLDEGFVRRHWPAAPRALFVSGYTLLRPATRPAAQWAMQEARRLGIPVAVDPASYALIEDAGAEAVLEWMSLADMVFPNRDEGRVLAGAGDPDEMLERLSCRFPLVVLKLDKDGARVRAGGEAHHVPAEHLQVVDTTGAGDAFDAAFLAAYLNGVPLVEAARAGVQTAARVIQRLGST
ncbi:MAG: hypothetical protein BAA04_00375 [Firmicutes bacterium ZCTH02-B6]|nr:MAG: hypothetical protein BAA04_00375 [Firmicutes bacterium ZCTH02-B6]